MFCVTLQWYRPLLRPHDALDNLLAVKGRIIVLKPVQGEKRVPPSRHRHHRSKLFSQGPVARLTGDQPKAVNLNIWAVLRTAPYSSLYLDPARLHLRSAPALLGVRLQQRKDDSKKYIV